MRSYVVSESNIIIGFYNEIIDSIIVLMDNIINKFNLYLDIIKLNTIEIEMPDINSICITSIIQNSSCVKAIYKFDIKNYNIREVISNEILYLNCKNDSLMLNYKIDSLKKIINEIGKVKKHFDLNIFITNNILDCEANNDKVINSHRSQDFNFVDKKENNEAVILSHSNENVKENKEEKIEKEKVEEFKRRYESDKKIYLNIKDEINESNIPELFKDQYPIMKILDNMNIINDDNGFNFYYKKMSEIISSKTNIYSSMFNDSSYFYAYKKHSMTSSDSESNEDSDENLENEI